MPDDALTPPAAGASNPARLARFGSLGEVCRLGLATRGGNGLGAGDVLYAIECGVNYLNWCGERHDDGLCAAVRGLGAARSNVVLAAQFSARSAANTHADFDEMRRMLDTDYIDVLTLYYVETRAEWEEITGDAGAMQALEILRERGLVRAIGVTTHQRTLAAAMARTGRLGMLMVRYNAAHRGAETEVFPEARRLGLPVVVYTALRWGALIEAMPGDPPDFAPPTPADCYRFALMHPDVTVCLAAPATRAELDADLRLLDDWRGLDADSYRRLCEHGDRVRAHAEPFP